MTSNSEIMENSREYGPRSTCRTYGLWLPELVECITGIPTRGKVRNAIERTNDAEEAYRESGLAIESFPTLYHRHLTTTREEMASLGESLMDRLDEEEEKIRSRLSEQDLNKPWRLSDRETYGSWLTRTNLKLRLKGISGSRKLLNLNYQELSGEAPWQDGPGGMFSGGLLYDNHQVDAALVGQWQEEGEIHEVYTSGGETRLAGAQSTATTPRNYFEYSFDAKTGDLKNLTTIPPGFPKPIAWLDPLLYVCTLTMSAAVKDIASIPLRRSLEKKVLENAQANWERINRDTTLHP